MYGGYYEDNYGIYYGINDEINYDDLSIIHLHNIIHKYYDKS